MVSVLINGRKLRGDLSTLYDYSFIKFELLFNWFDDRDYIKKILFFTILNSVHDAHMWIQTWGYNV